MLSQLAFILQPVSILQTGGRHHGDGRLMTQFKMTRGTYDPLSLISRLNTGCLCEFSQVVP